MSSLLKGLGLTLEDLKIVAKAKCIKDYESTSENELLSPINPSRKAKKGKKAKKAKKGKKPKRSFSKAKIEKIRKEFNE